MKNNSKIVDYNEVIKLIDEEINNSNPNNDRTNPIYTIIEATLCIVKAKINKLDIYNLDIDNDGTINIKKIDEMRFN